METLQIYIAIGIVALAVIALVLFLISKRKGSFQLSPLAGIAFGFVIAGIIFGEKRLLGYGLMAVGVTLAIIDAVMKYKKNKQNG